MPALNGKCKITDFQKFIQVVYGLPDDRFFSLPDLISNQERFTMRALKGIRKGEKEKIKLNLLISFSWLMAIANRLHIDIEESVWNRFPYLCSYCGHALCACGEIKPKKRVRINPDLSKKPKSVSEYQKMFNDIYPADKRTSFEAGVHLAEETGEISEIVHWFLGSHEKNKFEKIKVELADWVSCLFGVANSENINIAKGLAEIYIDNCHVCHKSPCICGFSHIGEFKS